LPVALIAQTDAPDLSKDRANGRILIPDAIRPPAKSIDADQPQAPDW